MDFRALAAAGLAPTDAAGITRVPLSDRSRGRLKLGDITVLFQFVAPPPAAQSLGLPAAVRGGFVASQDWPFMTTLLASLVLQVFSVAFIVTRDYPEELRTIADLDQRFIETDIIYAPPPIEKKVEVIEAEKEPKVEPQQPTKVVERTPKKQPPKSPENVKQAERRRMEANTRGKTILAPLGSNGGDASAIVKDLLAEGADMRMAMESFGPASNGLATNDGRRDPRRRVIDTEGSLADLVPLQHAKGPRSRVVRTGTKTEKKLGRVGTRKLRDDDIISTGPVDTKKIASVIRRRKNRIMNCYTRRLKQRNDLAGKVNVRFTILPSGRARPVTIIANTTGDKALGKCIINQISRWPFPRAEASATVDYPFIFTPAR
jgi:TonB family protein